MHVRVNVNLVDAQQTRACAGSAGGVPDIAFAVG